MGQEEVIKKALGQMQRQQGDHWRGASSKELADTAGLAWTSAKRLLQSMVDSGQVMRTGKARATRYLLPNTAVGVAALIDGTATAEAPDSEADQLRTYLQQPLGQRKPVGYNRNFVDDYSPNETTLLPKELLDRFAATRMHGQQPAGTYARNVMEPLLIDLSWSSSRLEGNRYSMLDTLKLFQNGTEGGDTDAVMLLNHKQAIEYLVDDVPLSGLTQDSVRNLHTLLMRDLLHDPASLGAIRNRVVGISDTSYQPTNIPALLGEMFEQIIAKARAINHPIEAAFFLWVNIAYLQPFEDGNKRTSRLAANIPLLMFNYAPLSFLDVNANDYAYAMMGVYEQCNTALAAELFESAYERSVEKYKVQLKAVSGPDPDRLRLRGAIDEVMGLVVRDRMSRSAAVASLHLGSADSGLLNQQVEKELQILGAHNCARFRLTMGQVNKWIEDGRPG